MQRSGRILIWAAPVSLALIAVIVGWMIAGRGSDRRGAAETANTPAPQPHQSAVARAPLTTAPAATAPASDSATMQAATAPTSQPASLPTVASTQPATSPAALDVSSDQATAAYEKGMRLLDSDEALDARSTLSEALLSGQLSPQMQDKAIAALGKIADETIFSSSVAQGDPYTFYYTVQAGDRLALVERKLELHVPWHILLTVNHITRPEDIRMGQQLKMIKGPFHAVVNKGRFTMDLFLQRENLPRVWVKRIKVGLGKNGSTPLGMWRVGGGEGKKGGKLTHPTWNPPPSSAVKGPIAYGTRDYALGTKGLWIGLVGTDAATADMQNYGIHSTSDPSSIGKEESLGCVRLADDDIELVYALLYEVWSTVQTRK